MRCACLTNGAVLAGFTLRDGQTQSVGDHPNVSGGGAWCDRGGILSNCVVRDSGAVSLGGGVFFLEGGSASDCLFTNNSADSGGGVACYGGGAVVNTVLCGNTALTEGPEYPSVFPGGRIRTA